MITMIKERSQHKNNQRPQSVYLHLQRAGKHKQWRQDKEQKRQAGLLGCVGQADQDKGNRGPGQQPAHTALNQVGLPGVEWQMLQ